MPKRPNKKSRKSSHKDFGRKMRSAPKRTDMLQLVIGVFDTNPDAELSHKQVCYLLGIKEVAARKQIFDALTILCERKAIHRTSHFAFARNNGEELEGQIQITQNGAGFVSVDGFERDIYISPKNKGQALNGDKVVIQLTKKGTGRKEGRVVNVSERDKKQFVGILRKKDNVFTLYPDNQRTGIVIRVPDQKINGAKEGEKVLVKITVWPKTAQIPYGEVISVLGKPGDNDTEMLSILLSHDINPVFPDSVMEEAEGISVELDEKEIKSRKDLRDTLTFTIDPVDAKDFDDAISYEVNEKGNIEVGVHIADVSHYVVPGTEIDQEAVLRSNSVYLVDRVIPMLPEQLSNLVCSLRPNEDKFCFSVIFEMDHGGDILSEWYGKTVIHSNRRFTYEEAQEILEGNPGDYAKVLNHINTIAKKYRKARLKKGALNIESNEIRFKLDDSNYPVDVYMKTSKDAHKLIEEFMLLANRAVATYLSKPTGNKDKIPMVYRVHDLPDHDKMQLFAVFIEKFGHKIDINDVRNIGRNINKLLDDVREESEYGLVQSMAIRSMAKATYETDNIGHYGLSFQYYTHFTSPIRRYADLVVHRILQRELNGQKHEYGSNNLSDICKRVSKNERSAAEAERESTKYFQTLLLNEHIGEEFDGTVSGLSEYGMFVRINANHCEGMVRMTEIPGDRYHFDADKFKVVGAKYKKEYNFGDAVRVLIYEVNPRKRQVDLELV